MPNNVVKAVSSVAPAVALTYGAEASDAVFVSPTNPLPAATRDGFFTVAASFVRPADVTAYAAGDLVANSTSAAVPLEFPNVARATGEAIRIERVRMRSDKTPGSITNASFIVHIFRKAPVLNVNDNAAFQASGVLQVANIDGYVGTVPVVFGYAAAIGARGVGVPAAGSGITCEAAGAAAHETSLWVVVEANAAYVPASGETVTVTLEGARS